MPTLVEIIPDSKLLSISERRFFRHLLDGAKPTDAAVLSFNVKNRMSATVRASQTLSKFNIKMPVLMEHMGMTDEEDIKKLFQLRNAKVTKFFQHEGVVTETRRVADNATQTRALELTLKLKGYLSDNTNVQVNNEFTVIQHMRQALHEEEQRNKEQQALS